MIVCSDSESTALAEELGLVQQGGAGGERGSLPGEGGRAGGLQHGGGCSGGGRRGPVEVCGHQRRRSQGHFKLQRHSIMSVYTLLF